MSEFQFNPEVDLDVNTHDLTSEFKKLSLMLYRYFRLKAKAQKERDIAKSALKEAKAKAYKRIKSDISVKHTEKSLESEVELDTEVLEAQKKYFDAEHDATTCEGAVESMKAKKDMLIQLGSDRRKEQ